MRSNIFLMLICLVLLTLSGCSKVSFEPIASQPFFLNSVGNQAEFLVEISEPGSYEIALFTENEVFPIEVGEKKPFKWKLTATVFYEGKLVGTYNLGPLKQAWFLGNEFKYFSKISLGILPSIKSIFGTKEYVVKVTVEEIDKRYTSNNLPVKVVIRRSPII